MKLLLITSVKEFEEDINKLFKNSEVEVYSTLDIEGYKFLKSQNIKDNWFSDHRDAHNSKLYFTFSEEYQIDKILSEVKKYNSNNNSNNPIKAIVIDVEKHV